MNKITSIETQKKNEERVNIYIDNEYAFSCYKEIVFKEKLQTGIEVDRENLEGIILEEEFLKCKNSALRVIERTYKTEKEMRDKLLEKEFNEKIIEKTIDFLKEYNFLNDEKYSVMYAKDRSRTQGKNKIKYSLIRKGVNEGTIHSALENIDNDGEEEIAYNMATKKYKILCNKESDQYKINQKIFRFLLGRGYEYDMVKKVLRRLTNEEEEDSYV